MIFGDINASVRMIEMLAPLAQLAPVFDYVDVDKFGNIYVVCWDFDEANVLKIEPSGAIVWRKRKPGAGMCRHPVMLH